MSVLRRALVALTIASSIVVIASCDDDDRRRFSADECDWITTRCRTNCGYYFCDSWGCYPSCFDQCWDECHRDPNKKPGVTNPPATDASSPTDDASTGVAVLCAPCDANDDCKGGGLCIHPGGAGGSGGDASADAGDAAPSGTSGKTGFCGSPCSARNDCPEAFACAVIGSSKQCLPISGKCE